MGDADIIKGVLAGQTGRFGELVCRYLPLVRGLCASIVHNPISQDDLAQDAFLKAYEQLDRLRRPERFGPWLAVITRRTCYDWLRREKRTGEMAERLAMETVTDHPATPEDAATAKERRALVRNAIAALPAKTREAMHLYYVEGATVEEGAAFLSVSQAAFKKRLQHGRTLAGAQLLETCREETSRTTDDDAPRKRIMAAVIVAKAPWQAGGHAAAGATAAGVGAWMAAGTGKAVLALAALVLILAGLTWPFGGRIWAVITSTRTSVPAVSADSPATVERVASPKNSEPAAPVPVPGALSIQVLYAVSVPKGTAPVPVPNARLRIVPVSFDRERFRRIMEKVNAPEHLWPLYARSLDWTQPTEDIVASRRALTAAVGPDLDWGALLERVNAEISEDKTPDRVPLTVMDVQHATTHVADDSGRFTVSELPAGAYAVQGAVAEGMVFEARRELVHVAAGSHSNMTLQIHDASSHIEGHVIDAQTGKPLANKYVTARCADCLPAIGYRAPECSFTTDEQGAFDADLYWLPPAPTSVQFTSDWFLPATVVVQRERGTPARAEVVVRRRGVLNGRVTFDDGAPVAGATIIFAVPGLGGSGSAKTDADGYYVTPQDGGTYDLYAMIGNMQSPSVQRVLLAGESEVQDFTVPRSTEVTVRLMPYDEKPISSVDNLALLAEHATFQSSTETLSNNQFSLHQRSPGHYTLTFLVANYQSPVVEFDVVSGEPRLEVTVPLEAPKLSAQLRVRQGGKPLPGVKMELTADYRKGTSSYLESVETGADGIVALRGLAPGNYHVSIGGTDYPFSVPAPEPIDILLDKAPEKDKIDALYFKINAFDHTDNDRPLLEATARTYVVGPSGRIHRSAMLFKGENWVVYLKPGYPAGFARVNVTPQKWDQVLAQHTNVHDDVAVYLGRSGGFEGRATGPCVSSRQVAVFPADWVPGLFGPDAVPGDSLEMGRVLARNVTTNEDGSFSVDGLPPGTYVAALSQDEWSVPFEVQADHITGPVLVESIAR